MNTRELLARLDALGVALSAEGGKLKVSAARGQLDGELKQAIGAHKAEILVLLADRSYGPRSAEAVLVDTVPEGEFPLSFAQRRLWFLDHLEPGNSAYNLGASIVIDDAVDIEALEKAINDVVRRQAALRTVFPWVDGDPVQVVKPFQPVRLEVIDLAQLSRDARTAEAQHLVRAEAAAPFDLAIGPLFRAKLLTLDVKDHMLLFSMHHIVSDNWSLGIFLEELREHYRAYRAGGIPSLAPLPVQYGGYAARERARLVGPELERLLGYWRMRLAGAPPTLDLPSDRPRPPRQTFNGAVIVFELSAELSKKLRALARREHATLYMTLLAVFMTLLNRYTGQTDIVVGTPIANRPTPELERLIGLFVSTLPIRGDLGGDPSIRSLIAQVRDTVLDAQAHQDLPFEKLVEALRPERTMAWSPIFQVAFVLQNTPLSSAFAITSTAAKFDLTLFLRDDPTGILGAFEYNTDLFDAATIERMRDHFRLLAEGVVAYSDLPISRLPMLSDAEREQLLVDWNSTASEYPRDATIPELFDLIAAERPEAIALESADSSREFLALAPLTYRELAHATNQLAARLRANGVRPDMPIGIYLERSVGAVIALLAVLKAGAAYVPLDIGDPETRIADVVRDANVRFVLTRRGLRAQLLKHEVEALVLEDEWEVSESTAPWATAIETRPDSLAYVMFTSGTTGRPKGVCVTHRNIVRLVRNTNYARFGPDEVILQFAPLAFDASTFEIWGALLNGGRLVAYPHRVPMARELAEALDEHGITTLWLTAGFFHYVVENEVAVLARVRQVLAGGDVLSASHVRKLLDAKRDGVVVNGYGPTENTTFTCCHSMTPGTCVGDTVPIGRPIANTRVYILDAHGEPVPIGIAGELFAGGDGVACGYLGDPAASAGKFVPDPFSSRPGATMYRTGDLARWRADGTIEFLGRRDRQVKVRGFRIELEEIEGALRACARVQDVAVIARRDTSGANVLVAYLVPRSTDLIDQAEIRRHLVERLPDYMVPSAFVMLKALPLTPNGKLDHAALPEPVSATRATAVVEPRTMIETQLHAIWEQVLGRSGLSMHDNFFDLGGHSLLAVRLFAQIERIIGSRLPISTLFQAPTLAQLAARLEHEGFTLPWSSLVAIQPNGSKPPIFLVPGLGGNVVCYSRLARLLGHEQPVYGLQSRGLDGCEVPFERIEPMAAHYISEIRRVQPAGPYYLGGTCFGGVVAYEMAQQLRSAGEEVAFLVLIETWPPPRRRPIFNKLRLRSNHIRFLISAAKRNLIEIAKRSPQYYLPELLKRLKIVCEIVRQGDVYRGDRATMYMDSVSLANHRAFLHYRPHPYDGDLLLVFASARKFRGSDHRNLWSTLSPKVYSQLELPASSSGPLLTSPNVEVLAEWVLGALQSIRSRPAKEAPPAGHCID